MGGRSCCVAERAFFIMVLVDTSVWVDFFAGSSAPHVERLESLIGQRRRLYVCGVILMEVLQGIRADKEYQRVKWYLDRMPFLPMTRNTFVGAADIYRSLRRRGITVRKPIDCLIAAVAIEHNIPLLHHDRDFDPIERHLGLKVAREANPD